MTDRPTHASTTRYLPAGIVWLWLLLLVVAPNSLLVAASFMTNEGGAIRLEPTFANYQRLFERTSYLVLIQRTVLMALAAAIVATLIAFPMAYFASRYIGRFKYVASLLVVIPLWISLLMRVFAWKIILGENGVLNSFLVNSGILDVPTPAFIYNRFTVVMTLAYVAIPYVFVTSYAALERIPGYLVEASRDCGASGFTTFRRVIWPLSRQGVAVGFALAFLLAVGDYVTPSMVGGLDGTMIGVVIASQFGLAGNWPLGSAMALVLVTAVAVVLGVLVLATRSRGVMEEGDAGHVEAAAWSSLDGRARATRVFAWVLFAIPYVVLYGPLAVITIFSFNASEVQALPMAGFTLEWYARLADNQNLLAALQRSLVVGAITVVVAVVVGTGFALAFDKNRVRPAAPLKALLALPIALPGIILGISLALTFRVIDFDTPLMRLVAGHAVFIMPVVMLIVLARLNGLDPSLEDASSDLGATRGQTLRRIILPLIRTAIIGAALLGFTLSFDEMIISLFLTGAEPTLPIFIWNQLRFGFTPEINAIFAIITLVSLVAIAVATRVIGGERTRPPA
jgi:spermidine/putrescine transport system permease protein